MAADDRDVVSRRRGAQAIENGARLPLAVGPDRVDHGERPAAHRRDVGEIDHHAAPAGEPGIGGDESVEETLDGEQQMAVGVGNRRAIVADAHGRAGEAEPLGDEADVGLRRDAGAFPQRLRQRSEFGVVHQAAFLSAT